MEFSNIIPETDISQVNLLLIAVLAILVIFTVAGYKRGFIRLAISLASMFLWIFIISFCTPYISDFLRNETDLNDLVAGRITEAFAEENAQRDNTIYDNHRETIDSYRLPEAVKKLLVSNDTEDMYELLVAKVFEEYVSRYLADLVIRVVSFVLAYLIAMLIMKVTLLSADFIAKLPVVKGLNRSAGAVAGFFEGALIVIIGFTAATFIVGRPFYEMVRTSRILSFIYDHNPLFYLLQ